MIYLNKDFFSFTTFNITKMLNLGKCVLDQLLKTPNFNNLGFNSHEKIVKDIERSKNKIFKFQAACIFNSHLII